MGMWPQMHFLYLQGLYIFWIIDPWLYIITLIYVTPTT